MNTVYIQQTLWCVTVMHDMWHVTSTLKRTITKSTLIWVAVLCALRRRFTPGACATSTDHVKIHQWHRYKPEVRSPVKFYVLSLLISMITLRKVALHQVAYKPLVTSSAKQPFLATGATVFLLVCKSVQPGQTHQCYTRLLQDMYI